MDGTKAEFPDVMATFTGAPFNRLRVFVRRGADAMLEEVQAWKQPEVVQRGIPEYSTANSEAVTAYLWDRYGRITANFGIFRTNLGYQAHHLDLDHYDQFYRPRRRLHRGPPPPLRHLAPALRAIAVCPALP